MRCVEHLSEIYLYPEWALNVVMPDHSTRFHRDGLASHRFFARNGEGKQASDCRDRAFDEGSAGAEEWPRSQNLL